MSGMPEEARIGLFGMLPEQVAAARPVGAPRLRKAERRQVSLRPISLGDLLPSDHRARFVWAFAERLDLSALYGAIRAVEGHPGHPPADPRVLLALWLYATVEGVGSARELDRLCREHIGFMEWPAPPPRSARLRGQPDKRERKPCRSQYSGSTWARTAAAWSGWMRQDAWFCAGA